LQSPVFTPGEIGGLAKFFQKKINPDHAAVYDIYGKRDQGEGLAMLSKRFPDGLIRVGLQPGRKSNRRFIWRCRILEAGSVTAPATRKTGTNPASARRNCKAG
jgi:hypothetical protein